MAWITGESVRKNPIDVVPRFYELTNPAMACAVCKQHKYVVIQKLNTAYAIHTYAATPNNIAYCIHAWRTREEDPYCLGAFTLTDNQAATRVSFTNLLRVLQGNNPADNVARLRLEVAREAQMPRPRINARRFRNVFAAEEE